MRDFIHVGAKSVDEAIDILQEYGRGAVINAGGTDLLGVLRDRIMPEYPEIMVDIKTIPDLRFITESSGELRIGAAARLAEIVESEIVNRTHPALAMAAHAVATPQIRNMATAGGNLCQDVRCWYYRYPHHVGGRMMCFRKGGKGCFAVKGDNRCHAIFGGAKCFAVCPSDLAVALTALDALIVIAGPNGRRVAPIGSFYREKGTILENGEILTEVRIPKAVNGSKQSFTKFTLKKPVDFALASVAAHIAYDDSRICTEARIVLGAVALAPIRAKDAEEAIQGKTVDEDSATEAARAAVAGAKALSMNGYKIEITKALVKKTLLAAAA